MSNNETKLIPTRQATVSTCREFPKRARSPHVSFLEPLNGCRLQRLEHSEAVERLERLERTDPRDEQSEAVERLARLERRG